MVLDYSKWDALELSDDSDIEVHPNVDKRSFIRAKQNQIHQQRWQRRHEIETLKYERVINDGLLLYIDKLLDTLRRHEDSTRDPEELIFQSLVDLASNPNEDQPPPPPEGVHAYEERPKYSQMMSSLVDQVKKEIEKSIPHQFKAYTEGVQGHKDKVLKLQQELLEKLAQLEKEEKSKITSDNIHTGFDSSFVTKSPPKADRKGTEPAKAQTNAVELLNPDSTKKDDSAALSSSAEADVKDEVAEDEPIRSSDLAQQFAKIKVGDYRTCLQFISEHPEIVVERETDGLLIDAFNSQMEGKSEYARQCVHQALLLQYCRSLGRDGIALFFKRITTKDHQAATLFRNDVNETYNKIKIRAAELSKNSSREPEDVEQIQLQAVDSDTTINITIPPENSSDPDQITARQIFDSFPPGLQHALESESLDEVNKVLGKMSVDEAEDIVEKLSRGGMLNVEEGIVDTTTEEGRKKLIEIEAESKERMLEDAGEPGE